MIPVVTETECEETFISIVFLIVEASQTPPSSQEKSFCWVESQI